MRWRRDKVFKGATRGSGQEVQDKRFRKAVEAPQEVEEVAGGATRGSEDVKRTRVQDKNCAVDIMMERHKKVSWERRYGVG